MRSYADAKAYAAKEAATPSRDWQGWCQVFAQACIGAAPWGKSAQDAWNLTPAANRHQSPPPAGALAYWKGGSKGFGHVAFAIEGEKVYSTDILRTGKVDLVDYSEIARRWGQTYLGWIDTTPSGPINLAPAAPALPVVRLSVLLKAIAHDLPAPTGQTYSYADVYPVEQALAAEGLLSAAYVDGSWGTRTRDAYKAWQIRCGFTGTAADGIPGLTSLTKLGKGRFTVIA